MDTILFDRKFKSTETINIETAVGLNTDLKLYYIIIHKSVVYRYNVYII